MMKRYALIAFVALGSSAAALADDSRQFGAVVCVSQAGTPWREKARGTLTRTRSKDALTYEFKAGKDVFTWRFVTSAEGATTAFGPGLLLDRFAEPAKTDEWPERKQSIYADGEIREYAPSSALMLRVGSKCPAGRSKASKPAARQPRLQVEEDGLDRRSHLLSSQMLLRWTND